MKDVLISLYMRPLQLLYETTLAFILPLTQLLGNQTTFIYTIRINRDRLE